MNRSSPLVAGYVEVDLAALARNYEKLEQAAEGATVAAVVKGNAYGLGMVPVAQRLYAHGCASFFVATLEEGLTLRAALPRAVVYVLEGVAVGQETALLEHRLRPVLNTPEQARRWLASGQPCAVHVDTGMNRLGMSVREAEALAASTSDSSRRSIELLVTHLACAEHTDSPLNHSQVERFAAAVQCFPHAQTSIGNSAAIFLGRAYRGSVVRPGIGLYGGNPFDDRDNPMEVVVSLKGRVLQLRDVDSDSTVGYGATHRARRGDRLATIAVGYADGYPRQLGGRGSASVAGHRVPIVGRVSMDLLCIDVSTVPRAALDVDQYVELFGNDIKVEEVAALCGTINYEILSRLGPRLERVYVG